MKPLLEKLFTPVVQSSKIAEVLITVPRVVAGILLAFVFGASKFGMLWTPKASNLSLFEVSHWFIEDVSNFGGVFAKFPEIFAWMAAATESIGGLFLILGFKTRLTSLFLAITMLVAIFFQKWNQDLWGLLPAMGFLWIAIYHLVLGSGRYGIDYLIANKLKRNNLLITPLKEIKAIQASKTRTLSILFLFFLMSCKSQNYNVILSVDTNTIEHVKQVSVLGSISPLSWEEGLKMTDEDGDGVYKISIPIETSKRVLKIKFKINNEEELQGSDSRVLSLKPPVVERKFVFNEYKYYTKEEIEKFTFTENEIKEDMAILSGVLQYIHPAVYKFKDSISLNKDFKVLEEKLIKTPSLPQFMEKFQNW